MIIFNLENFNFYDIHPLTVIEYNGNISKIQETLWQNINKFKINNINSIIFNNFFSDLTTFEKILEDNELFNIISLLNKINIDKNSSVYYLLCCFNEIINCQKKYILFDGFYNEIDNINFNKNKILSDLEVFLMRNSKKAIITKIK